MIIDTTPHIDAAEYRSKITPTCLQLRLQGADGTDLLLFAVRNADFSPLPSPTVSTAGSAAARRPCQKSHLLDIIRPKAFSMIGARLRVSTRSLAAAHSHLDSMRQIAPAGWSCCLLARDRAATCR
jgi:hypothetical protein